MQSGALKEPGWRIRSQIDLCRIAFVTLTAKESTGQSFDERVIARGRSQHADFSMEPANHTFLELRSEQRVEEEHIRRVDAVRAGPHADAQEQRNNTTFTNIVHPVQLYTQEGDDTTTAGDRTKQRMGKGCKNMV